MKYNIVQKTLSLASMELRYQCFQDFDLEVSKAIDVITNDDDAPLFGDLWESGRLLCETVADMDCSGKSVIELGCGLGLPSIIAAKRGAARVIASDYHKDSATFVNTNAGLNKQSNAVDFMQIDWRNNYELGSFDIIMASDVLYEPELFPHLARFISKICHKNSTVLIADPKRVFSHKFDEFMINQQFANTSHTEIGSIQLKTWKK